VNKEYGMDASVADHIVKAADEVGIIDRKTVNIQMYSIPKKWD
jgi:hypothetical protein